MIAATRPAFDVLIRTSSDVVIRPATLADLPFLIHLAKSDPDALGFVPAAAVAEHIDLGHVIVADINGERAGYVLHGIRTGRTCAIVQTAVVTDARRHRVGTALANEMRRRAGRGGAQYVGLACGADLDEALSFWEAAGFARIGSTTGGKQRGRMLEVFRAPTIDPVQLELCTLPDVVGIGRSYASETAGRLGRKRKPTEPLLF